MIARAGYPDPSQFDDQHRYYDEKSTEDEPRWFSFDVKWKCKFKRFVHLADLKANDKLADMRVVQRGQRLSIQPVAASIRRVERRKSAKWEASENRRFAAISRVALTNTVTSPYSQRPCHAAR